MVDRGKFLYGIGKRCQKFGEPTDVYIYITYLLDMGPAGFEPATNRLCIPLQLSPPLSGLWSGLSLHPWEGCLPSSLYTFLAAEAWFGITISSEVGFPEFGR